MSAFTPAGGGGVPVSAVIAPTGLIESLYGTVLAVASNATVTVVTHTMTGAGYLLRGAAGGTIPGVYDLMLNGTPFDTRRSYFTQPSIEFEVGSSVLDAYPLSLGDIIAIRVHTSGIYTGGNYEARLQWIQN